MLPGRGRFRLVCLALVLSVGALSGRVAVVSARVAAPPAPVAAPAQQRVDMLAMVRQAFDLLYGGYVDPISSDRWLNDAWNGISAALSAAGAQPPPAPVFDGDPADDWPAFAQAFRQAAALGVLNQTDLAYSAIQGMTQARNSCHTAFVRADQASAVSGSLVHQQTTDIGMVFGRDDLVVYRVYPGGPADRAGFHEGDTILTSNGQGGTPRDIRRRILRAAAGQSVQVTVRRPGFAQPIALTLTPEVTVLPFIRMQIVGGNVGVLQFDDFTAGPGLVEAIRQAIAQFEQQGVVGWVLDLRTNSGGDEHSMAAIASLFMSTGRILVDYDRSGVPEPLDVDASETLPVQRPLVVLTEKYSASAAEFLPGALQDDGRAYVIGTPTDGCVSGSLIRTLADGSLLQVQVVRSLVGNDMLNLDGVGVIPNLVITRTPEILASGQDPQMDAAVQYIHSQVGQ